MGMSVPDLSDLPAFNLRRMIMRGEFVPQQATFWRRSVMDEVVSFDTSLDFCMDHDLFICAGRRYPAAYVAQPFANFRLHPTSKSVSAAERHWRESLSVCERHGMTPWTAWYWIRRLRHYGFRALPEAAQARVRRHLNTQLPVNMT
jgi:hypothetical protein